MSMKEKLAVTVLVTTLALFGLVVVLYRMIKDKNEDYTQIVLNQHSSCLYRCFYKASGYVRR